MEEQRVLKSRLKSKDSLFRPKKRVRWWDEVDVTPTPWDVTVSDSRSEQDSSLPVSRRRLFNRLGDDICTGIEDWCSADHIHNCPAVEVAQFTGWLSFQAARKEANRTTPQVKKPEISESKVEHYIDTEGRKLVKIGSNDQSPNSDRPNNKSDWLDKGQQLRSLRTAQQSKVPSNTFAGNVDYTRDNPFVSLIHFI